MCQLRLNRGATPSRPARPAQNASAAHLMRVRRLVYTRQQRRIVAPARLFTRQTQRSRGVFPMIDFTLTDEQQAMRDLAHTFAEEEIRPVAAELDEREEFPWELVKKAGELGLTNFAFPEEIGGLGITDELTNCIITEELSWGCAGVATVLGGTHLASIPMLIAATHEQKQRLLKPIIERNGLCAMALTEPGAGSDVAAMTTTAVRDGDSYVLNGAKRFITNGGIADLYVVLATVDRSLGHRGVTAFVVPGDAPGLAGGKKEK